jgi:hypothetical protein
MQTTDIRFLLLAAVGRSPGEIDMIFFAEERAAVQGDG